MNAYNGMGQRLRALTILLVLVTGAAPLQAGATAGVASVPADEIALLMDERAITALLNRYIWALDTEDLDEYGRLFAHAVVLSTDGRVLARGAEEVAAMIRHYRKLMPQDAVIRHVNSSPLIEVDTKSGTASARSFVMTVRAPKGEPAYFYRIARYLDRFDKVDGKWRFASRQELSDWVQEEYSRHFDRTRPR